MGGGYYWMMRSGQIFGKLLLEFYSGRDQQLSDVATVRP